MSHEERLAELLERWEDSSSAGQTSTLQEFCRDCPDLLEDFRNLLGKLGLLQAVMQGDAAGSTTGGGEIESGIESQRFRSLSFHAGGGLGLVYLAEDRELRRNVALKCMRLEALVSPNAQRQFQAEAEITGKLEHPGIVPVYGLGVDSQNRPYYAMRFVRGETLGTAIDRYHAASSETEGERNIAFRKLLRHFITVCETVAYAHARGVIHRDIKPGNIMLGPYGETLLVDWGLAKRIEIDDPEATIDPGHEPLEIPDAGPLGTQSIPGRAKGSPAYMSPEQARGEWDRVGFASDVYSLGSTLYVLLTSKKPYAGKHAYEVIEKVKLGKFPAPRTVATKLDPALDAVCRKAMHPETDLRYSDARELAKDLERWLADEPVSAWREPLRLRFRRWLKRNRTLMTGLFAALIVGVAATIALAVQEREKNDSLSQSNRNLEKAIDEKELANTSLANTNIALGTAKTAVETQRDLARENFRVAQHNLYLARMLPIGFALGDRQYERAEDLFRKSNPEPLQDVDHRGFEWYLVRNLFEKKVDRALQVQPNTMELLISPDGKRLATRSSEVNAGNRNGRAAIYSTADGERLIDITFLPYRYERLTVSRDATVLAVPEKSRIDVYFIGPDNKPRNGPSLKGFTQLDSNTVSEDGKWVAGIGDNGIVRVWDAQTGKLLHEIADFRRKVDFYAYSGQFGSDTIAISPDRRFLILGLQDNFALWDIVEKRKAVLPEFPKGDYRKVRFTSANTLCVWNSAGDLWAWPVPKAGNGFDTGQIRKMKVNGPIDNVCEFAQTEEYPMTIVHGGGKLTGFRTPIRVVPFPILNPFLEPKLKPPVQFDPMIEPGTPGLFHIHAAATGFGATPDGKTWAIADTKGKVKIVQAREFLGSSPSFRHESESNIGNIHFTPQGELITHAWDESMVIGKPGQRARWMFPPRKKEKFEIGISSLPTSALSQDGRWFAVTGREGLTIVDEQTLAIQAFVGLKSQTLYFLRSTPLAFVPGKKWLVFPVDLEEPKGLNVDKNSSIMLWDFEQFNKFSAAMTIVSGKLAPVVALRQSLKEWPIGTHCSAVATSPDGVWIAAGGNDKTVRLWKTDQFGKAPAKQWKVSGAVNALCFSPESNILAVGAKDASITIFTMDESKPPHRVVGKGMRSSAMAFSPDGKSLVTSDGKELTFIDRELWLDRFTLATEHEIWSLAFSPDGTQLAVGSGQGSVRIYHAPKP